VDGAGGTQGSRVTRKHVLAASASVEVLKVIQSSILVLAVGPVLRILQLNVEGLSAYSTKPMVTLEWLESTATAAVAK